MTPARALSSLPASASARRISVAPMLAWTDRHCRYFHRLLTRCAWLYTEMITTGALLCGEAARHLDFDPIEQPVALQLGGSEPADLAQCAQLAEQWGYNEINLNCGCPSQRVQRGAFGACLMAEPARVADCVKAMVDKVSIPVTVKHRIGLDRISDYAFVRDFVGTAAQAGAQVFIVHARNAILQGLSPGQNRDIPPLNYEFAYQLKRDFPALHIVLNGGITSLDQAAAHLRQVDGVMMGRQAYCDPWLLADIDRRFYREPPPASSKQRGDVERQLIDYAARETARGTPLCAITRHVLGLYRGLPGARGWRRILSDHRRLANNDIGIFEQARAASPVFRKSARRPSQ